MSRLVALLESRSEPGAPPLSVATLSDLVDALLVLLEAPGGRIEFAFPYFVRKTAPVSGVASRLDYEVRLDRRADRRRITGKRSRSRSRSPRCVRARRKSRNTARTTSAR